MQFTISAAALMAFAAKALAQVADFDPVLTPTNWEEVSAGKTLEITWQAKPKYSGEKISISLIGGATQNTQVPIKTIATGPLTLPSEPRTSTVSSSSSRATPRFSSTLSPSRLRVPRSPRTSPLRPRTTTRFPPPSPLSPPSPLTPSLRPPSLLFL
ncbi:Uncharacterized protein HZ326_24764, partial [Fusarium oxysporum f. sp. albedinis]